MKKITPLLLVLVGFAAAGHGSAAEPSKERPLDSKFLRDYAETRGFMLGRPVSPKPTPDGKSVLFLRAKPRVRKMSLFEFDVAAGRTRELLSPEMILKGAEEKLSPEEKARRERMRVTVGGITSFQLTEDGKRILISLSGKLYVFERAAGSVQELKTGQGTVLDPKFSPNGKLVGYVRDYDVYVYNLANDKEHRVTTGGTQRVSHGLAEFVAQEEMDRYSGYWWSPDSKFIAYEEADATAVETWHVADPFNPDQPPQPVFYPRPGKANVKVRVGVIPITGGETVWIKWDASKYPYLAQVRWDKYGPLTLTVQTREQQELLLLKSHPNSGKTTALLTEKDPAWVNLHQEAPRWSSDGKGFVWFSETESAPQLELRDAEGKRQRGLVPAKRAFQRLVGFDHETGAVAYQASPVPIESQIHIQLANGTVLEPQDSLPTAVMRRPAVETAVFSEGFRRYVLSRTTATALPRSTIHELAGALLGELPSIAESPSFKPKVELLKVGDDSGYYCSIVRPHGFDARNKYPVIVDVYGGPHHLHVQAAMGSFLLRQWLADQGFIVVSIDGRGTPGRGRDWERAIYKKFGAVPLEDQVTGLQALGKKYPELDLDRVGIVGWSFGGYMSALAALKRPDIFKAAVAGAPVVDWLDYDTHYTERYLGLPDQDPAAYKEASLLTYAAQLKRPLLLVHGTADDNVYFRHTLKLSDALFRAGKEFELLPLAGMTHMVPEPAALERLESRIVGFFQKQLGKPMPAVPAASAPAKH